MVQAIPVVTRADPTATRSALTEGYLSQPMIMAHGAFGWLQSRGTLNLEGLTLERGELSRFAPFGSDDPMARPFEEYPVNHHLAQVLERIVAVAAVRKGPVIAEIGAFNGDEPTSLRSSPDYGRFGDSWAARLTIAPLAGMELSGSIARVTSPSCTRATDSTSANRASLAGTAVRRRVPGATALSSTPTRARQTTARK